MGLLQRPAGGPAVFAARGARQRQRQRSERARASTLWTGVAPAQQPDVVTWRLERVGPARGVVSESCQLAASLLECFVGRRVRVWRTSRGSQSRCAGLRACCNSARQRRRDRALARRRRRRRRRRLAVPARACRPGRLGRLARSAQARPASARMLERMGGSVGSSSKGSGSASNSGSASSGSGFAQAHAPLARHRLACYAPPSARFRWGDKRPMSRHATYSDLFFDTVFIGE